MTGRRVAVTGKRREPGLRLFVCNALLLSPLDEIVERAGADRLLAAGGGWREAPLAGPDRKELVKVVSA